VVFSSVLFLFYFLPIAIISHTLVTPLKTVRNIILLALSLIFYTWGEGEYVLILLISVVANYSFGIIITKYPHWKLTSLRISIFVNLFLLGYFKYANFIATNINTLLGSTDTPIIQLDPVHLPIGISFFTFQALSYVIDVYRGKTEVQKNVLDLALYIALFPQLIAGPIVRYTDIASQIITRVINRADFASGIRRFTIGLAKKVVIADQMSIIADTVFAEPALSLNTPVAWLGIIAYTLQICFDFSGYSDMAIGLGRVFGFTFLENFNYPYISQSIREFWRRWHISLSTWFRDYLYIPLGGNRSGVVRTYLNLYIVFFFTGLWHGASWNFIFWGLWHGTFLVIERLGFEHILDRLWRPFRHLYTIFVVLVGWVIFRADTLDYGLAYLQQMFTWSAGNHIITVPIIMTNKLWFFMILGILLATPIFYKLHQFIDVQFPQHSAKLEAVWIPILSNMMTIFLMAIAILMLITSVSTPFIYFRF